MTSAVAVLNGASELNSMQSKDTETHSDEVDEEEGVDEGVAEETSVTGQCDLPVADSGCLRHHRYKEEEEEEMYASGLVVLSKQI